ncbi:MAG: peptidyl-dipeptidase A [Marinoscillum sp.]|jgi:peptidyl-dipeptidase A
MRNLWILILLFVLACAPAPKEKAQAFIDEYTNIYKELYYASAKAEWEANTKIKEGDTTNAYLVQQANEALAKFTGSEANIQAINSLIAVKNELDPLQVKQLETMLYAAANNPAIIPDVVAKRIKAEAAQNELLFGFDFQIDGKSLSTNAIDAILTSSNDLAERQKAWEASKAVGVTLKSGLSNLRDLRNETVGALGYPDYFTYQVSNYGMTSEEMMTTCDQLVKDIWPLYRELHTYTRYNLAEQYSQEVPEMLPAHWLTNRWGQDWSSIVEVEGIDLDGTLEKKGPKWLVEQAERFYISLGFQPLPNSFYTLSSLYPLPDSSEFKKNNHASAWHLDLENDVRSLMSVVPNAEWYETTHHELGHIYYYMEYTNPNVPPLLREGANRAFHEAIGSMMGLAAMQKPFLEGVGLIESDVETDEMQTLLKEALNYVVFIPFSAGVMTQFEQGLYATDLSEDQFNEKWWALKAKYQGIVPPSERGSKYCDAASKTHINNDAAQYYDYALSFALLFQLHDHIATNILKQDPRATNYYGNKEVGDFLHEMLSLGATKDWRTLMKETTGDDINAKAMLNYFEPLMAYLKELNAGRKYTLPESI